MLGALGAAQEILTKGRRRELHIVILYGVLCGALSGFVVSFFFLPSFVSAAIPGSGDAPGPTASFIAELGFGVAPYIALAAVGVLVYGRVAGERK